MEIYILEHSILIIIKISLQINLRFQCISPNSPLKNDHPVHFSRHPNNQEKEVELIDGWMIKLQWKDWGGALRTLFNVQSNKVRAKLYSGAGRPPAEAQQRNISNNDPERRNGTERERRGLGCCFCYVIAMEQQHKVHSWETSPFIPFFLQLLKLAIKCKSLRTFNVFVYGFPSQSLEHATTEGSFHSCFSSSVLWGFTNERLYQKKRTRQTDCYRNWGHLSSPCPVVSCRRVFCRCTCLLCSSWLEGREQS